MTRLFIFRLIIVCIQISDNLLSYLLKIFFTLSLFFLTLYTLWNRCFWCFHRLPTDCFIFYSLTRYVWQLRRTQFFRKFWIFSFWFFLCHILFWYIFSFISWFIYAFFDDWILCIRSRNIRINWNSWLLFAHFTDRAP